MKVKCEECLREVPQLESYMRLTKILCRQCYEDSVRRETRESVHDKDSKLRIHQQERKR